jgi:endonuclease/exonuclease/phosphatase family metal-dependent hydrolase
MRTRLRVFCWNIQEGGDPSSAATANSKLTALGDQINLKLPDIVLLNEVINWDLIGGFAGNNINQTQWLSRYTGLQYYYDFEVNTLGWAAHKAVAILSKYPLKNRVQHQVPKIPGQIKDDFGTLEATVTVDGKEIYLFSTRFCPGNSVNDVSENTAGHKDALRIIQSKDPNTPIIFGGDFNADITSSQFSEFFNNCGLTNALNLGVDNIFYRGAFSIAHSEVNSDVVANMISDHSYLFVEFIFGTGANSTGGNVSIQSINFKNTRGRDIDAEFVLLNNLTSEAINMTGWKLYDRANHQFIFPSFTLAPNEQVKVWTKSGLNDMQNLFWNHRRSIWNNQGDRATLKDNAGDIVSTYSYLL